MNKPQLVWLDKGKETFLDLNQYDFVPVEKYGPGDNKLYLGDNLVLLKYLLENKQKVDLIYIDPPFATNSRFFLKRSIGEAGYNHKKGVFKFPCYEDIWQEGLGSYLSMLYERLKYMHQILRESGSIYVHVDFRVSAYVRLLLDEIFGEENFINEIIWFYKTGGVPEKIGFSKKHDTIFFYARDKKKTYWSPQKEKSYLKHKYGFSNISIEEDEQGKYTWVYCRDVFDIPALRGNQPERLEYATQKPEELLKRIILASSKPKDVVADFFCGSGTTLAVAQKLERKWIGCDCGKWPIHVCRKRLLGIEKSNFSLLKIVKKQEKKAGLVKENNSKITDFCSKKDQKTGQNCPQVLTLVSFFEKNDFFLEEKKIFLQTKRDCLKPDKKTQESLKQVEFNLFFQGKSVAVELINLVYFSLEKTKFTLQHWSDWVDFWAVGRCKQDYFEPLWYSFRTRFQRKLVLKTSFLSLENLENLGIKVITFEPREYLFRLG